MAGEVYECAYCERKMRSSDEVFGLGVRLKEGLEYPGAVGRSMAVHLTVGGREIACMVAADASQAKAEGWDLVFMVCCEECGAGLKEMLNREGIFEEIM